MFAGQRDEPFFIDTGSIFDLLGLRPFNAAHLIPLPASNGVDGLAGYNVHTIALQVPIQLLTRNGLLPTSATDPAAVIGVYGTASRPGTRVVNTDGTQTFTGDCSQGIAPSAACVQVSRLGNPLANELFIPRGDPRTSSNDKDLYNAQLPATDNTRVDFFRGTAARPVELVNFINLLYNPPVLDAPTMGRDDLVNVFLLGIPGANRGIQRSGADNPLSELMRLNMAVPPTPFGSQNRIGFAAGDMAGFPNGRRPADDVVDIELRVAAGILLTGNQCTNSSGTAVSCNQAPNNQLGDGVNANETPFRTSFPYLGVPVSGYENPYHGRTAQADTTTPGPGPTPTPRP